MILTLAITAPMTVQGQKLQEMETAVRGGEVFKRRGF